MGRLPIPPKQLKSGTITRLLKVGTCVRFGALVGNVGTWAPQDSWNVPVRLHGGGGAILSRPSLTIITDPLLKD